MQDVDLRLYLSPASANAIEKSGLLPGNPAMAKIRMAYLDIPGGDIIAVEQGQLPDLPLPLATAQLARHRWTIEHQGAQIAVAIDRGEIMAGDRQSQICEIGLRLTNGSPSTVFDFAHKLDEVAPLRAGVRRKAERARLLTETLPRFHKAEPVVLSPEMSAGQIFQTVMLSCLRQFRLNEDILLTDPNPEAVHQARVALRRARSAMSIFKPLLGDDAAQGLRDDLRWLAGGLANAREIDVLLDRAKPGELMAKLGRARRATYADMAKLLAQPRARRVMLDLAQWLHDGDWCREFATAELRNQSAREFAASALRRFRRKVRRDGRDLENLPDAARHELRKDAKKLRYATDFFEGLYADGKTGKQRKHFVNALEEMQDVLGALNDMAMAPQMLEHLGIADDPEAAVLLGSGKSAQLSQAAKAYDTLVGAKRFWK
ncbi:CHAD domain-containing protein [Paracoccus laeviglucosivorans]|uniref:CHAD domain-containing protein n=1 Tax=Paracoccus laeviglucosivorans TaxID=1197861 RepID=A0A521BBY9_9RHOB|nr:CHAD domain-containing protein [Paracoccus laeviglucosivorans]SMO44625.1 CHAD domain-containing protein [Paracoccus laeviglucosivorans]